ncbi:MAG: killer suppression protein [Candidatus Bipolaricaulota bacterium]|nr:killer suppression protein [Candidatus Bipolaricaulota bacterium]
MEILFKTRKMQKTISSQAELVREYAKQNAKVIMRRMMVLHAAKCLADVPRTPPDRCHPLFGKRKGQYVVDAKHPYRIIMEPANNPIPFLDDGSIAVERITSIRILEVKDYH